MFYVNVLFILKLYVLYLYCMLHSLVFPVIKLNIAFFLNVYNTFIIGFLFSVINLQNVQYNTAHNKQL